MISDNLSKKLSEIQDTKPLMSDPEIESGRSRTVMPPKSANGNRWSMWPMYLCFGVPFVVLLLTVMPRR